MFSSIVVGTDGSKDADRALRAAAEVASGTDGATVHVVTAFRPLTQTDLERLSTELPAEFRNLLQPDLGAEENLSQARAMLEGIGVDGHYHQVEGDPTDAILDAAQKFDADLIVVGSRGEGMAKRALHGSVSTKVVHHAPCAVLVVRHGE